MIALKLNTKSLPPFQDGDEASTKEAGTVNGSKVG